MRATLVRTVFVIGLSLGALACSAPSGRAAGPRPSASASASTTPRATLHCPLGHAERERVCARIAPRVSIATTQVCAALVDGSVYCWGRDDGGQLLPWIRVGTYSPTPRAIQGVRDAIDVAASQFGACAIERGGAVLCWGGRSPTPQRIEGVAGAIRITAGPSHFCALQGDRRVACWGDLGGAQLDGADRTSRDTRATLVGSLSDAVDLVATSGATCVLEGDHGVTCFGSRAPSKVPAKIDGLAPIARLLGSDGGSGPHLCGIGVDGALHCWGRGDRSGRTPDADASKIDAVRFDVPSDGRAIAIGRDFACGLFDAGDVYCTSARLERGTSGKAAFADDMRVAWPGFARDGGERPVDLVAAGSSLCASYESGHVRCVGANHAGQVGTGEAGTRFEPKLVAGVSNATQVVLTTAGGCAATRDGVHCWGFVGGDVADWNLDGFAPRKLGAPADAVWLGRYDFTGDKPIAIDSAGKLWSFGPDPFVGVPASMLPVEGLVPISDITGLPRYFGAGSRDVDYATTPSGSVLAVGPRAGGKPDALLAQSVTMQGLGLVRAVRKRNQAACAVRTNGTVACWRIASPFAEPGQPKAASEALRPKLLEIPGLANVEEISTALMWCARRTDGSVACFTMNDWVDEADPAPLVLDRPPSDQPALAGAKDLDGPSDLGALTASGKCLYQGPQVQNYTFDPYVLPCDGVVSYSVDDGGCEVRANGDVACWGDNHGGRIGSGERTFVLRPEDAHLPAMTFESAANQRHSSPR